MPKMVEVDETQLLAKDRVVSTVNALLANPKARRKLLEAQKEIDPSAVIPEIDAKNEVLDEVAKINKRLDDEAAAREKDRADREAAENLREFQNRWDSSKSALRNSGYTAEAIDEIEKLAKERGIADLDAAAALFDRIHPPASAASSNSSGNWHFFEPPANEDDGKFVKQMIESRGEDDAALSSEINKTLSDLRGQRRAA